MNFQAKNRQWKNILIALMAGIIGAFLSWLVISEYGISLPEVLVFVAIAGILYAFLLFLFVYKKNKKKEEREPGSERKSISIPVVSISKTTDNTKAPVPKITEIEKFINLTKSGIIPDKQFLN